MATKMIHNAPSQRRKFRVNAPISIMIDGDIYKTIDWSVIDFRVRDYKGSLKQGDKTTIVILIPYQGFNVTFEVEATITVKDEKNETLAGEFPHLNERHREILEAFVAGLVKGEMEGIDDVIRRMDVPVTPASLKPDAPLTEEELVEQHRRRQMGSVMYLLAGVIFSIALLVVLYTNFFQIKVRTAGMAAPTDIILAPATGDVRKFHVEEKSPVAEDTALITFNDPELEQDIERAGFRLQEALLGSPKEGDSESDYAAGDSDQMKAAKDTVRSRRNALNIKAKSMNRLRQMMRKGLTTRLELERAEGEYYEAQSRLNHALEKLNSLTTSGGKVVSLSYAESEYSLLKEQRDRLKISAAANGRIISYLVQEGSAVRYGDPVAIFQHNEPKYVEAYLTRDEAVHVAQGDVASVYFPAFGISQDYLVSTVDYASQLVSKRDGRYTLDQAGLARDVLVRMTPVEGADERIAQIEPGSSAVVVFDKTIFGR